MRLFFISLLFFYSLGTLKGQSIHDTTFFPNGDIRFFDTAKKAWLMYHFFNSAGVAYIDEYDSSDFTYFKTGTAFNLDGSCALKLKTIRGIPTGNYAEYFKDGQPKQIGHFFNGFKTGRWLEYYPNGQLAAEYLFRLTHEDSTFISQKYTFKKTDDFKVSLMKVEWGHDDLNLDDHLKYKNIIMYQFSYFSPTILPSWKKYNSSGKIIETSDSSKIEK